jgi:hypothetical protein
MHFGFVGGANVLYTDPDAERRPMGTWSNWGGDKTWPWPQDGWRAATGKGWPPPPAVDQGAFTVDAPAGALPRLSVRMTSAVLAGYGVRCVREVSMARDGARLTVTTAFVPEPGQARTVPLAAWTITQVPVPAFAVAAAGPAHADLPGGYRLLGGAGPWPGVAPVGDTGLLALPCPAATSSKVGTAGDTIAVPAAGGDAVFVQRIAAPAAGEWAPGERAQIYLDGGPGPGETRGRYLEMEFTSPILPPGGGGDPSLTIEWELRRAAAGEPTPDRVAAVARGR